MCHNEITDVSVNGDNTSVLPACYIFDADYTSMTTVPGVFSPSLCYSDSLISMNGNGIVSIG